MKSGGNTLTSIGLLIRWATKISFYAVKVSAKVSGEAPSFVWSFQAQELVSHNTFVWSLDGASLVCDLMFQTYTISSSFCNKNWKLRVLWIVKFTPIWRREEVKVLSLIYQKPFIFISKTNIKSYTKFGKWQGQKSITLTWSVYHSSNQPPKPITKK